MDSQAQEHSRNRCAQAVIEAVTNHREFINYIGFRIGGRLEDQDPRRKRFHNGCVPRLANGVTTVCGYNHLGC